MARHHFVDGVPARVRWFDRNPGVNAKVPTPTGAARAVYGDDGLRRCRWIGRKTDRWSNPDPMRSQTPSLLFGLGNVRGSEVTQKHKSADEYELS